MQNRRTFLVKTSATMKAYDWLLNPAFKRTKFKKGAEIALSSVFLLAAACMHV